VTLHQYVIVAYVAGLGLLWSYVLAVLIAAWSSAKHKSVPDPLPPLPVKAAAHKINGGVL
jgi:hypothetical protein